MYDYLSTRDLGESTWVKMTQSTSPQKAHFRENNSTDKYGVTHL